MWCNVTLLTNYSYLGYIIWPVLQQFLHFSNLYTKALCIARTSTTQLPLTFRRFNFKVIWDIGQYSIFNIQRRELSFVLRVRNRLRDHLRDRLRDHLRDRTLRARDVRSGISRVFRTHVSGASRNTDSNICLKMNRTKIIKTVDIRIFEYRILEYRIFEYRIFEYRILEYRIFEYRIFEYRILEYRILEYRILEYRILEYRILEYRIFEYRIFDIRIEVEQTIDRHSDTT